ncbi:GntR family transcriptional regulator [Salinisphaera dokdonensis CL-ES53]|uniref:GntR family transcriptional regulator n=1 Tax=Salinisphaera dokdonensis CL-ES53 TaxID=1304272 RepID=A0ABV2B267_9GAMM
MPEPDTPRSQTRASLADRVHDRLKTEIFDFRLMPGDRLSENEIAARVDASRTPVREALFRLQREGYVEMLSKGGWQVRPFDFDTFEQLYDVRVVLENAAVRRICEMDSEPAPLTELQKVWLVPEAERLTDNRRVWHLDEQFHATLVAAAGNREMARIHQDVTERIRIIRRLDFTKPSRVAATYDEHGEILRTLACKRIDQTQRFLKSHIETSRNEVRKITLHMLYAARAELASGHG